MKTDNILISECCGASVEIDGMGQAVCTRCGCDCEVQTREEVYYDEVRADDERVLIDDEPNVNDDSDDE